MEQVLPITKKSQIYEMYQALQAHNQRDYLLFSLAIHTGIKLSSLINLKVSEIVCHYDRTSNDLRIKEHWCNPKLPEIIVPLPLGLCEALVVFIQSNDFQLDDYIFQSSKTKKPLSRQQAYRIIHDAAECIGLKHIGLQSLRKTFAYHAYQANTPLTVIQKYLGHQTLAETIKFIGIPEIEHTIKIQLDI